MFLNFNLPRAIWLDKVWERAQGLARELAADSAAFAGI